MITKEEAVKAYSDLIQLRRSEILVKSKENLGQIEIHHIVPRSCNGEDDEANLIALYAKEHFMAHVYLWIIHHDDQFHDQTVCALNKMIQGTVSGNRKDIRDFILASEEYQKAREEFVKYMSSIISDKVSGFKNGNYGKHWYKDPNSSQCGSFEDGKQPNGWIVGRYQTYNDGYISSRTGKILIRKKDLSEQKYISKDEAEILLQSDEWEHKALPLSEKGLANIRKSNEQCRKYTNYAKGIPPKNKDRVKFINITTNEIVYMDKNDSVIPDGYVVAKNNVKCCISIEDKSRLYIYKENSVPAGYVLSSSLNKRNINKEKKKRQPKIDITQYVQETQEMADYYTNYGYEETCKKFPGRSGTCSVGAMPMRFINARRKYGIKFETFGGKNMKRREFSNSGV